MNPTLIAQYGFKLVGRREHGHNFKAWKAVLRDKKLNEIQVIIDASLAHNSRLVHQEIKLAEKELSNL